jgi:hypothetical protein
MSVGSQLKRFFLEFYLKRFYEMMVALAILATIGFTYTFIRGTIYMYYPVDDAYYAQHYEIFKSKINAKNYFKQFASQDIVSQLNAFVRPLDPNLFKQEAPKPADITSWPAEQDLSKKLFNGRMQITQEEYKANERRLKNELSWNRKYDGHSNINLTEKLQKKYDFNDFIGRLYLDFSNDVIDSVNYLDKRAEKSLPLNTVVYKKITGSNVGLPAAWFYKNLASTINDIEPLLQQQNAKKELRYQLAYWYFMCGTFFLGFLLCSLCYFFHRRLTKIRSLVFYDGEPV